MTALVRYVWSDTLRSQRWLAPVLAFALIEAIVCANTGSVLPTYAMSAAALLFIATWISVVTINNEDPIQQTITVVCAGSQIKVRIAKLLVALFVAMALGMAAMVAPPLVSRSGTTLTDVWAGLTAQLLTALTGVALGALCSRPLISFRAWSVIIGFGVCLLTVIVPYGPPTRQLLVLLNKTAPYALGPPILLIAAETVVITVVAIGASLQVAQRRS